MGSPWSPNIPERESGVEAALAGDAARARAIDAREVEPAFEALADRLAEGALDEREQVAASLAELRRLGRTLVVATPIAFTVGLSLTRRPCRSWRRSAATPSRATTSVDPLPLTS
jgi:hypothetical protein